VTDGGVTGDADVVAAVTELGDALRGLVDASVTTAAPAAELRATAAAVRALAERLASDSGRPRADEGLRGRLHNPVSGVGNAMAAPLLLTESDGGVGGDASFGPAYEGPPGWLHGGMSGLLLDEVLGKAAAVPGYPGMTARLELDYRRPVPLSTPLRFGARITEVAGRKTTVSGTIASAAEPGRPLVEARGLWIVPRTHLSGADRP
jgi:acyl-coenzyme A thioesterase PaaI-like protein